MTDHLKEIWNRFEKTTSRNLTGGGVDNIPRPAIEEMERHKSLLRSAHEAASVPMPEGVSEPAQAAFDALRQRLTTYDKKGRAQPREANVELPSFEDDQLKRDLAETERLVTRREVDYLSHAIRMQAEEGQRRKRKRFLGIF